MIESLRRSHGPEMLRCEGVIPPDLRGQLYRAGPGALRRFGRSVHPFLADGAIHRVDFGERPLGASRMIETTEYLQEERLGRALSGPNATLWRRLRTGLVHHVKNTGNTNVMEWQGRFFALMEAGLPVEIDGESLQAYPKATTLGGVLSGAFSAHPHRVASHAAQYNFTVEKKTLRVFCFPDTGVVHQVGELELPHMGLIHDFMVTERYAIFFLDPGRLTLWRAILQTEDFSKWFSWDETGSSEIVLMPLQPGGVLRRVELPPFRVWHFVNAFDRGDEVVIDVIRHNNMDAIQKPIGNAERVTDPQLTRYVVTVPSMAVQQETLYEAPCEFPRVRPVDEGVAYAHAWLQTFRNDEGTTGFARVNMETGESQRYCAPEGVETSEPVVVEGAKHPWVLQLEGNDDESCVAVHDGRSAGEGPVARVFLSEPIPPTFHGIFVPAG